MAKSPSKDEIININKNRKTLLPTLPDPELFFGFCAPVGVNIPKAMELLEPILRNFGYVCQRSKITTLMKQVSLNGLKVLDNPVEFRYDTRIKYANKLREIYERPDILASIFCAAVAKERRKKGKKRGQYVKSMAYLIDQIKRPEEINTFRQIYGKLFVCVSIYSDKDRRIKFLSESIAESHNDARANHEHEARAKTLIARDEDEEAVPNGQRLRDAFPLADVFINIDDLEDCERVLTRFISGLFGSNKISPTQDEVGQYFAKSASLRSLDLSRQVGAAIFGNRGEVITVGYNEVPKPYGGVYTDGPGDLRDYVHGRDENERIKRALLADVVERLIDGNIIQSDKSKDELVKAVMNEASRRGSVLRDALLMDLLEYGRVIHAEMHAVSEAARLGRKLENSVLYCTTFPCHICAKHIIAVGIARVVFIEPYPKSYAQELHSSIVLQAGVACKDRVQFAPFIGISPYRFKEIFERGRRKNDSGEFDEWTDGKPHPIIKVTVPTYLQNEDAAIKAFEQRTQVLLKEGKITMEKMQV